MNFSLFTSFIIFALCTISSGIHGSSIQLHKRSPGESTCVDQFTSSLISCGKANGIEPNEPDPPTWTATDHTCCAMVNCLAGKTPSNDNACKNNFATNFQRVKDNHKEKPGCEAFKCFSTGGALSSFQTMTLAQFGFLVAAMMCLLAFSWA